MYLYAIICLTFSVHILPSNSFQKVDNTIFCSEILKLTIKGKLLKKAKLITYIMLTFVCMIAVFVLSSQDKAVSSANSPDVLTHIAEFACKILRINFDKAQITELHNFFRKTAHFSAYAVLSFFSCNIVHLVITRKKYAAAAAFVLCVLMAVPDEVHQAFVPGRSAEVRDVLIDTLGICVGLGLTWLGNTIAKKVKKEIYLSEYIKG